MKPLRLLGNGIDKTQDTCNHKGVVLPTILPLTNFASKTLLRKLSTVLLLVAVPLSVVVVGVILWSIFQAFQQLTGVQQLELTRQTIDKIDRLLYERYNDIASIGEEKILEEYMDDLHDANTKTERDESSEGETQRQTLNKRILELMLLTGPWESLEIASPSGQIVYSTNTDSVETSVTYTYPELTSYFDQVLTNKITYSDVIRDAETNKKVLVFMAPIKSERDPKRPVIGVVVGHLSWRTIYEIIQNVQAPFIELSNSEGVLIGDKSTTDAKTGTGSFPSSRVYSETNTNLSVNDNASQIFTDENGERFLLSQVKQKGFLNFKGFGWMLVIKTPLAEAFSQAYSVSVLLTLLILGLISALIAVLFLVVNRVIITPVSSLTKTTEVIANGDLSQRVTITSGDELGQLGKSFNEMTEKLQDIYENLEQKVQEKVAELAAKVAELGKEKAQDEAILKSIGEGLIALDEQGKVILVNQNAVTMLQLDEKTLLGQEPHQLYQLFGKTITQESNPLPLDQRPEKMVIATGKSAEDIFTFKTAENIQINLNINAHPIVDQGKVAGVVMAIKDVTHEQEVDRMKTEFISLASHQLRTPLSAIKWFSEMLLSGDAGKLSAEQTDFTKNIYDSTDRMIELVNSLLNISRIESGRIMVQPTPTNLKELVQSIVDDLKAKIEQYQHTLAISVHQDLPEINLDKQLIGQVYLNLLSNAIKYTPKNGEISVFISRKDNEVISQITDTGYGIPKAEQKKVFQKFFRADNVAKFETDGTGLGLYLVKAIIESSGGKIWFESEEGKGTTFWFSLPITGMQAKEGEVTLNS